MFKRVVKVQVVCDRCGAAGKSADNDNDAVFAAHNWAPHIFPVGSGDEVKHLCSGCRQATHRVRTVDVDKLRKEAEDRAAAMARKAIERLLDVPAKYADTDLFSRND